MKYNQTAVHMCLIASGFALITAMVVSSDVHKEKALQAQIDQLRAEKIQSEEANRLVGMWRYRGTPLTYKLITPTRWTLIEVDSVTGRVTRSKGGPYTLRGHLYTEKFEYDSSPPPAKDAITFLCNINGDTWDHMFAPIDPKTGKSSIDPETGKPIFNPDTGEISTDPKTGKPYLLPAEVWDRVK